MRTTRKTAGDTIVEVLISMAVASAVIGGAYAVVSRTLANARQAQEHAEALKIAQGQLESVKVLYADNAAVLKMPSTDHCIVGSTVKPASDAGCKNIGSVNYSVNVHYVPLTGSYPNARGDSFLVTVTWPSAVGSGNDTVTQNYKVEQ